jgi:hypothetical protein
MDDSFLDSNHGKHVTNDDEAAGGDVPSRAKSSSDE